MKIYSLPAIADLGPGSPVKAEVMASENGRSLVMLNGIPVSAEGEFPAGHSLTGNLAATDGGFKIIVADNSTGVTAEKLLQNAGIHERGGELAAALKEFGVPVNAQNLEKAATLLAGMPGGAAQRINVQIVSILLLRQLDSSATGLLKDYLQGNLRFASLFSELNSEVLHNLRQNWGQGKLMQMLQQLIKQYGAEARFDFCLNASKIQGLSENLQLQQLLSQGESSGDEARIYFQWPVFWYENELPDTLEGEAFIPQQQSDGQGFSLRLLIEPPCIGKMEVSLHELNKNIWAHFAVQPDKSELIASIFGPLRDALLRQNFVSVRLTIGRLGLTDNFFAHSHAKKELEVRPVIDVRI